jgi:hypothetical protein
MDTVSGLVQQALHLNQDAADLSIPANNATVPVASPANGTSKAHCSDNPHRMALLKAHQASGMSNSGQRRMRGISRSRMIVPIAVTSGANPNRANARMLPASATADHGIIYHCQ